MRVWSARLAFRVGRGGQECGTGDREDDSHGTGEVDNGLGPTWTIEGCRRGGFSIW